MPQNPSISELFNILLPCYLRCLKNKPNIKKSLFHVNYERELHELAEDIYHRRYSPGISTIFVVFHPKPREIIAASIRDRVVHHFIHDYMSPYWERRFVPNSYACRVGKGPLNAVKDARRFVKSFGRHSQRPLYYLKVDVSSFFPSIDLNILKAIIFKKLKNPLYQFLVAKTLSHRPVHKGNFILNSPRSYWSKIPNHKSMFYAADDKGLAIGNLTSQFYANIYLNELDQFIAHKLKGQFLYWQRYVDDVLFLSDDPYALRKLPGEVDQFLQQRLAIKLNPGKTILQPLARGVDHLGYFMKPDHMLVRQKNVKVCFEKLRRSHENSSPTELRATLNSYLGLFQHADAVRLAKSIGHKISETKPADGRLVLDPSGKKVRLKPDFAGMAKKAATERFLVQEFLDEFPRDCQVDRRQIYLREWLSICEIIADYRPEAESGLADYIFYYRVLR